MEKIYIDILFNEMQIIRLLLCFINKNKKYFIVKIFIKQKISGRTSF